MSTGSDYIRLEPAASVGVSDAPPIASKKVYFLAIFAVFGFLGATILCEGLFETGQSPLVHGSFSELPGFEKFYMKKHNLKTNASLYPSSLFSDDVCARTTSKDAKYPSGSVFYHGTLVDFSGYPFSPSWFAAELPPANKLAVHVPMAWMCMGKGGYEIPGKYWLKKFVIKESELLPEEVNAESFYNSLGRQAEEAKEYCGCSGERFGFIIDADAVDEQPEYIMCNPKKDMQYMGQHIGDSFWAEDGYRTLILDVKEYGKYSLNCYDPMGSFEVIREPSKKKENPDDGDAIVGPNCCSCCVTSDECKGEGFFGSKCFSPKYGKLTRCNRITRMFPDHFLGCDA